MMAYIRYAIGKSKGSIILGVHVVVQGESNNNRESPYLLVPEGC